ncbi:MAG TPA: amidase family protein, partial [Stellaceae bacterium]|nr:amidase family protein [Stellaceae bacterium]
MPDAEPSYPLALGVREAAREIAAKRLGVVEYIETWLARIAAREAEVGAWRHFDHDLVMAAARRADNEAPRGPLHGIPLAVKDVIDTFDLPTGYGSPIYANHRPIADAACVALARAAGAIVLGKTVSTEFAYFTPGETTNPHNAAHTPGGSSSGSAAAVGADMTPLAFGTQTAGSILRPASYCG